MFHPHKQKQNALFFFLLSWRIWETDSKNRHKLIPTDRHICSYDARGFSCDWKLFTPTNTQIYKKDLRPALCVKWVEANFGFLISCYINFEFWLTPKHKLAKHKNWKLKKKEEIILHSSSFKELWFIYLYLYSYLKLILSSDFPFS